MKAGAEEAKRYSRLVKSSVPARPVVRNAALAFVVGGAICAVGEVVLLWLLTFGLQESQAIAFTAGIMVAIAATLTGFGIYDEIGRVGGMGSALPITGFANSIVSPAMEFKREGFILGVSAKMFNVAGPVIVYGLLSAAIMTAAILVLR